jgi:two-component system LytT family response regulator
MRVVIVDDERLARSLLREFLQKHSDVEIVAECANGLEAVKAVAEQKPELIFLDIQMPRLDGFEVLDLVGREVNVIFVTAYDKYALRAFDVHARAKIARNERPPVAELTAAARPGAKLERVLIRDGSQVHVIPISKIDYIEAQDDYVAFRSEGKQYLKQQTLSEVEATLDNTRFVRIHRSYILNVDRLAKLELYAKDSHAAILRDGTRLPVSRTGYSRLNALL